MHIPKPQRDSTKKPVNLYQSAPRNIQQDDVWDSGRDAGQIQLFLPAEICQALKLKVKTPWSFEMSVNICQRTRFNIPVDSDLHSSRHDFPKWIIFINSELRWKQKQAAVSLCSVVLAVLFQYLYPKCCVFEICLLHLYLHTYFSLNSFIPSFSFAFFFLSFFLSLYSCFLSWSNKQKTLSFPPPRY